MKKFKLSTRLSAVAFKRGCSVEVLLRSMGVVVVEFIFVVEFEVVERLLKVFTLSASSFKFVLKKEGC